MANPKKIIFVHGTWSSVKKTERKRKVFLEKLKYKYKDDEIELFGWSGANSEIERKIAGISLAERINMIIEKNNHIEIHLIGHSHGGNVIVNSMKDINNIDHIKSRIFISTPLILDKQFQIDNELRSTISTGFAILFVLVCCLIFSHFNRSITSIHVFIFLALGLPWAIMNTFHHERLSKYISLTNAPYVNNVNTDFIVFTERDSVLTELIWWSDSLWTKVNKKTEFWQQSCVKLDKLYCWMMKRVVPYFICILIIFSVFQIIYLPLLVKYAVCIIIPILGIVAVIGLVSSGIYLVLLLRFIMLAFFVGYDFAVMSPFLRISINKTMSNFKAVKIHENEFSWLKLSHSAIFDVNTVFNNIVGWIDRRE